VTEYGAVIVLVDGTLINFDRVAVSDISESGVRIWTGGPCDPICIDGERAKPLVEFLKSKGAIKPANPS